MKKITFLLIVIILSVKLFAQFTSGINYQTVVRNAAGEILDDTELTLQIVIRTTAPDGPVVYAETHEVTTNPFGLVNVVIGQGTVQSGNFDNMSWGSAAHFFETAIAYDGNKEFQTLGVSQFLSVPYALYSKTAGEAQSGGQTVIMNDSLVLKDSLGVTRMVLNPNNGTFKMMNKDTVWYEIAVNSPPTFYIPVNGMRYAFSDYQDGKQTYLYDNNNQLWLYSSEIQYHDLDAVHNEYNRSEFAMNPNNNNAPYKATETIEEEFYYNAASGKDYNENIKTVIQYDYDGKIITKTEEKDKFFKAGQNLGKKEKTKTIYVNDGQGNLVVQNVEKQEINPDATTNTTNTYQNYLQGIIQGYLNVEEKNDPTTSEHSIAVKDTSGNGTSTKLAKDKFAVSNSNPNAKSLEYSYDSQSNSTKLIFVKNDGTKTNIAETDNLGNVYYGPNDAIKTNYLGETFLSNNTYIVGDLMTIGNTDVNGNLNVSGTKNFRITHPDDTSKYLVHAAIESNEVLNMYSGNVTTNNLGMAKVSLPNYFNQINTDFRYVLTVVGQTFAQAIVFQEIDTNNQFIVKTSEPNCKVSWQITARRNDDYLQNNPFQAVIDK